MDFSLFAHMERIDEGQSQKRLYDEFVELCQIADQSGFKTIWNGEHHGMNFTIAPNPFVSEAFESVVRVPITPVSYTHLTLPTILLV